MRGVLRFKGGLAASFSEHPTMLEGAFTAPKTNLGVAKFVGFIQNFSVFQRNKSGVIVTRIIARRATV